MMRSLIYFLFTFFLLGLTAVSALEQEVPVDSAWEGLVFRIEDSRSFVGIAPVYLSVGKLEPKEGNLVGTYSIRVPLKTSKNDWGLIVLPLDLKVSELGSRGGVLKGKAHSQKEVDTVSDIVCVILPKKDRSIQLAITTKDRTINFESRYSIIEVDG